MFHFENVEADMVWMSLVIFLPTAFALVLLFIPRGKDEAMRWTALIGTAATLAVSLILFIGYYKDVIDANLPTGHAGQTLLGTRAEQADRAALNSEPGSHAHGNWVARYPWIPRFNIDYYLGVD